MALFHHMMNYVINVQFDQKFIKLKGFLDFFAKLAETNKCNTFAMVYKLLKLALFLPVVIISVERVFSIMKVVKSPLCNKMSDH